MVRIVFERVELLGFKSRRSAVGMSRPKSGKADEIGKIKAHRLRKDRAIGYLPSLVTGRIGFLVAWATRNRVDEGVHTPYQAVAARNSSMRALSSSCARDSMRRVENASQVKEASMEPWMMAWRSAGTS